MGHQTLRTNTNAFGRMERTILRTLTTTQMLTTSSSFTLPLHSPCGRYKYERAAKIQPKLQNCCAWPMVACCDDLLVFFQCVSFVQVTHTSVSFRVFASAGGPRR